MPPTPPLPVSFQLAETYFQAGDYEKAARSYALYLRDHPSAPNQDRAFFHLAMVYAFADSPVHDPERARELLSKLVNLFPKSSYASQARLVLGFQTQVETLKSEVADFQVDIEKLESEVPDFQAEIERLKSDILGLQDEVKRLGFHIGEREKRIKELREELEKLKQIDMQRRPSRSPRR